MTSGNNGNPIHFFCYKTKLALKDAKTGDVRRVYELDHIPIKEIPFGK
jgi:hypothetical protein